MERKTHPSDHHVTKPPVSLKFVIEGKEYETFDQYKTGSQLKELAGIPLETDLFLKISEPYQDELIENDKPVNLARPETEYFFVKKKLHFFINGLPFTSYVQFITGAELRALGNIPAEDEIYLDLAEGWQDDRIDNDEKVDLARDGKEKFISKSKQVTFTLIVNAQEKKWHMNTITFEQVVFEAFGAYNPNPALAYTVSYKNGLEPNATGTMAKGSSVYVKNKMKFHVESTGQS